jgi:LemA protein
MNINLYLYLSPVIIIVIIYYIASYNALVRSRQKVKEAWSGIYVQLKRRYDLIPALISTVNGYAEHERNLLEKLSAERANLITGNVSVSGDRMQAEDVMTQDIKSVIAISEAYPDLKSNQNFLNLQEQLSETEDQISAIRRIYNSNTAFLNTKIESFPASIIASLHGFKKAEFFGK